MKLEEIKFLTTNYAKFHWVASFVFRGAKAFSILFDATQIPQGNVIAGIYVFNKFALKSGFFNVCIIILLSNLLFPDPFFPMRNVDVLLFCEFKCEESINSRTLLFCSNFFKTDIKTPSN